MSDTLMVVIGIFLAVILMFIFPLMSMSERHDDISQSAVQTATSEFVDKISVKGKITPEDYDQYFGSINAMSGAPYEVEIEVQHLDENPGKKASTTSPDLIGENLRYSTYTSEITDTMFGGAVDTSYPLNKGDNVIVTAKNSSKTWAEVLRTAFYKVTGGNSTQIAASASSMVVNGGN